MYNSPRAAVPVRPATGWVRSLRSTEPPKAVSLKGTEPMLIYYKNLTAPKMYLNSIKID